MEDQIAAIYGHLPGGALAIVAMGKLGGREMTATSDLDLVFIYTHDPSATQSNGDRPLPVSSYFARVAQRFIAGVTALTAEGRLFDVDMRLRPSGNQGPVAVSFDRFVQYHREHSWTWEKMALTRARAIAGPPEFRGRIARAVSELLALPCEAAKLLSDALSMRQKLAAQFPARSPWDLKFAPGGLVDIEFAVQVLQLCDAPPGVRDQNTIAAAKKLIAVGLIARSDGDRLIAAARLQQDLTQVLRVAVDGDFYPEFGKRQPEGIVGARCRCHGIRPTGISASGKPGRGPCLVQARGRITNSSDRKQQCVHGIQREMNGVPDAEGGGCRNYGRNRSSGCRDRQFDLAAIAQIDG